MSIHTHPQAGENSAPRLPLQLANAATARFECTYGRGCEGVCCSNSTPPVDPDKQSLINGILPRVLPLLRPGARAMIEEVGYIDPDEVHEGNPSIRVESDWCVFFNKGCVLHQLGVEQGDSTLYKPVACYLFPIDRDSHGRWYVRQHGVDEEQWTELFCLAGTPDLPLAVDTLGFEMEMAAREDARQRVQEAEKGPDSET
jgi:hypothetical protein